jgi:hypothetical protein
MMYLGSCRRCGGDVELINEAKYDGGAHWVCIQCGNRDYGTPLEYVDDERMGHRFIGGSKQKG